MDASKLLNRDFGLVRLLDPVTLTDAIGHAETVDGVLKFTPVADPHSHVPRYMIMPGLRDVHVHFRDPGMSEAETRHTGALAAAAGGFTCVTTMPNTNPAGDNVEWIREQLEDPTLPIRIAPSACISKGRLGAETADLELLAEAGAFAFTDDGTFVDDENVMRDAMIRSAKLGKVIMQHAVVPGLQDGGVMYDGPVARKYNLRIMPPSAEIEAVRRDISLCRETGCALHIQHISTSKAVDLIHAAQAEGLPVTAEATPHHLLLSCEDIPDDDANWKMAPPLGQPSDRIGIRKAVLDGTISLFATDHAPHPAAAKSKGFAGSANGIIGLETALAVTWKAMVEEEHMPPLDWANRWTVGPAKLIGETPKSVLSNEPAEFTLVDLAAFHTVKADEFKSKSNNQPYTGITFTVWPIMTVMNGKIAYEA